jgi:hypothetical protein
MIGRPALDVAAIGVWDVEMSVDGKLSVPLL